MQKANLLVIFKSEITNQSSTTASTDPVPTVLETEKSLNKTIRTRMETGPSSSDNTSVILLF